MVKQNKLIVLLTGILFILISSCTNSNDELYDAIVKGSLTEVEKLIDAGVDINYKYKKDKNKSEYTALHYAVKYREFDIAELLIEKGANVNAVDIYGWHPLLYAVNDENFELAELLLQNGADLKQKNTETGNTSIDYAGGNDDTKMINLLLEYKNGKENLTLPVEIENTDLNDSIQNNTIQIFVKITGMLPIGWGTKYKCEVQEIKKGVLIGIDSTFVMSVSIGSENKYKNIHFLKSNEIYSVEFVKSERKTDKSYIPAGTTGLLDKNGAIWDLINLKKVN